MLGGLKGLGDIGKLMSQAQEMQAKAQELQESLARMEIEGSSGAGLVTAIATGKGEIKGVKIDPSLLNADEAEVLEDLIVAAVADAQAKATAKSQEEMGNLMGGMGLPPGMGGMMGS